MVLDCERVVASGLCGVPACGTSTVKSPVATLDLSTSAKFVEHVRGCRIMGVMSHYKQAVRYGLCISESEHEFVGKSEQL